MKTVTLKEATVKFHWHDGTIEEGVGRGEDRWQIALDALRKLGYGGGVMAALDYWEIVGE